MRRYDKISPQLSSALLIVTCALATPLAVNQVHAQTWSGQVTEVNILDDFPAELQDHESPNASLVVVALNVPSSSAGESLFLMAVDPETNQASGTSTIIPGGE